MKKLLLLLLLINPAHADTINMTLGGSLNVTNITQIGNSNLNFTAPNGTKNTYTITQQGGNHSANVQLNGNFDNYIFSLTQNSSSNLSISITQTCPSTCTPSAYTFTQY